MRAFLLVLFFILTGCSLPVSTQRTQESSTMMPGRYLALGDSYTIGEAVTEEDRFPEMLARELSNQGFKVETKIIARTGWTTGELWRAIESENLTPPYNLVTLLIGVNNQYRGGEVEQYRLEFEQLLDKAISLAGGDSSKVIVLSIPDWGVTPFAQSASSPSAQISTQIDKFNTVNKTIAESKGSIYINVTEISRQAAKYQSLLAEDGLHPSGKMYAKWIELLLPAAVSILEVP
jgi:lysophospholipase L1-like esterase